MMNERIKELAEQAWIETSYPGSCRVVREWSKEKFAELIVRECIWEVVKDNQVPHNIQVLIGERFKQHFGVEE